MRNSTFHSIFWLAAFLPVLIVVLQPLGRFLLSLNPSPDILSGLTSVILAAVLLLNTRLENHTLGSEP